MNFPRHIEPEWLDDLPAHDPRAQRSRRDLSRINGWMGQVGIMAGLLRNHYGSEKPRRLLEIGAGDGTFMLRLALRLAPVWPAVSVTLLDRQDIVSNRTREASGDLQWKAETAVFDIFSFLETPSLPEFDIVIANLFLHHFSQEQLALLLARLARLTKLFVACEPRRSTVPMIGSRLLWAIGCNDVSRHDAAISVRAGFSGTGLSSLWPDRTHWDLHEHAAGLFTHCFVANSAARGAKT